MGPLKNPVFYKNVFLQSRSSLMAHRPTLYFLIASVATNMLINTLLVFCSLLIRPPPPTFPGAVCAVSLFLFCSDSDTAAFSRWDPVAPLTSSQ